MDWLLDSVVLVGIEAVDRDNGFRIFESTNDRGARLTSVDLIKSFLLSRARRDEEKLNGLWRDMLAEVTRRRGDAEAPKEFLKAYLIAQHADLRDESTDVSTRAAAARGGRGGQPIAIRSTTLTGDPWPYSVVPLVSPAQRTSP